MGSIQHATSSCKPNQCCPFLHSLVPLITNIKKRNAKTNQSITNSNKSEQYTMKEIGAYLVWPCASVRRVARRRGGAPCCPCTAWAAGTAGPPPSTPGPTSGSASTPPGTSASAASAPEAATSLGTTSRAAARTRRLGKMKIRTTTTSRLKTETKIDASRSGE